MKPILLHYYITNRCNSKCEFCSIWKELPKKDAKPEDVINNLIQAKKLGCSFVDFTGGEPLLHKDLPLFLLEAKKLKYITSVTTNCINFPQRAKELNGLVDLLHFSLDADNRELHNKIRGTSCFENVLESIPIALSNNLVPDILFTYTNENIDSFFGVYEIAKKNRLMIILDPVFSCEQNDIVSMQTHKKAIAWSKKRGVYLNKAHLMLRFRGGNNPVKSICRAVSSTIVILPDNKLALPCFHHAFDFVEINGSLKNAINSLQRQNAIKYQGQYPFCNGCHINCYFDPSYFYSLSFLTLLSFISKVSYAFTKYFIYKRKIPIHIFS